MIRAIIESSDAKHSVRFDATPYFLDFLDGLSVPARKFPAMRFLTLLAGNKWQDCHEADEVAEFHEEINGYQEVADILDYQHASSTVILKTILHEADVLSFLKEQKPDLFSDLCFELDVSEEIKPSQPKWGKGTETYCKEDNSPKKKKITTLDLELFQF